MVQLRRMMVGSMAIGLLALGACSLAPTTSQEGAMTASLSGTKEVPPASGSGSGTMQARMNKASGEFTWVITYAGLSGPVTAAHFHGPAMAGQNADVALPITGILTSPMTGAATLTPAQASDLMAGRWYVNLHTAANPTGELRGQITPSP